MVNKVILIGNVGKDPEVKHLESGSVFARFSVATNESYKDKAGEWQQITEWHNVVVWRGLAERVEKSLHKGNMVFLEGKLTTRKWQDADGNDKYTTEVVANTLRILDKKDDSSGAPRDYSALPAQEPFNSFDKPKAEVTNGGVEDMSDDLPF